MEFGLARTRVPVPGTRKQRQLRVIVKGRKGQMVKYGQIRCSFVLSKKKRKEYVGVRAVTSEANGCGV